MRSDWQSHCLVITVWWTSIVFRLVETEACWASARSTNANLFHEDIISHCLLSNHNTCLTFFFFFCTMKMFCLGVYFILAHRRAEKSEGTWARSSVWCSTLRFIHLTWFLSDVVDFFDVFWKKDRKHGKRNCSDSPIKVILSESYCECDLICQTESPTAEHITSHAPWEANHQHMRRD